MHSIKTKLILSVSLLLIFLFSITALLLVGEKERELRADIYTKARATSELVSPKVVDLYESLLAEKSFVLFNREMKDVFQKNEDVAEIKMTSFSGDVLYNSLGERERAYEGPIRRVEDGDLTARIRANLPSYLLKSGRTVYLKKDSEGNYASVNENEKDTASISDTDEIQNIVYPLGSKYAVIFSMTYDNLRARVIHTTQRIVFLLIFGVLLGLGFGWYFSQRITTPIEQLTAGALVLAKGDFKARVMVKARDEVGVLADTFNTMAQELEISTKAMIEKEKLGKELEVAARIQREILPKKLPDIPGLDLSAVVIPATEIGGDCYDFIEVDPKTHLFYISDVTGHGIPSGIVVSIANAIIYSYANSPSLRDILISTNRVLKEKTTQNMFMTLLMLRYREGKLDYVSAGHPEMLHYYAEDNKVLMEKGGGIALGMVPDISRMVTENSLTFSNGDCIVLYSDGIPEAVSERGEQYGMQRFKRALSDNGELGSAVAIKNALIADVKQFMGAAPQMDDITLVVLRKTS
ncbi:MAG: SpoIIE family protein phosphatase [Patescibacteria group bacterium]